jgi:PIN domain nuclease of toxin-antitoxin system
MIASQQQTNQIAVLPVNLVHVLALESLPAHHKDPFDRLLIAQAREEDAVLVSSDPVFARYQIEVLWSRSRKRSRSRGTNYLPSGDEVTYHAGS